MIVLHCIPNMAGGGAERQLTYLVKAQCELGLDTHIVMGNGGPNLERLQASGATIHMLRGSNNHDPLLLMQLIKLVRRLQPDIVQTWLLQMDVLGGLAALFNDTPFILSERSSAAMYPKSFKWLLRTAVARKSAAVIANSSGGRSYWNSVLSKRHPCFVVPNAIPLDEIGAVTPQEPDCSGLPKDVPRMLFVGRLSAEKNVSLLLDYFSLATDHTDAVVLLCGQGIEESKLRDRVSNDKCLRGRVFFLSYQANIWGLMKYCHLFISLSSFEGYPNVVMEAVACELPLFLSDIPAHREVVGDNAWYAPDDPKEAAACLLQALQDNDRNRTQIKAAHTVLQANSAIEIAQQVNQCYETVLNSSRKFSK